MKFIPAILLCILLQQSGAAQPVIKGRTVNAATGTPVQGCSIFITNTSKGTISDANGYFELTGLPPGKHELVVSSIGYETSVFSFSDAQLPLTLKVEMKERVKELANVTLEEYAEEGWDKWGKTFMENFVGTSSNAASCRISNEKAIRFRYYKKSNRLIGYCDEPVLLENTALGYNVSYQLEHFEVNFREGSVTFLGYSLFVPFTMENRTKQYNYAQKRKEAYNGSVLHFMRSIYTNRLREEGFDVVRMQRVLNNEKQRVKQFYKERKTIITRNANGINSIQVDNAAEKLNDDSAAYYTRVMKQPDFFEMYDTAKLSADSLLAAVSGEIKSIAFDDYLFITYKNEKEEPGYLKLQFPARKAGLQRSYVFLTGDRIIAIDMNGNYYSPQDFVTTGYWGWSEKMANSLPLDYEPDE